jgi:hypothetical protein
VVVRPNISACPSSIPACLELRPVVVAKRNPFQGFAEPNKSNTETYWKQDLQAAGATAYKPGEGILPIPGIP